MGFICDLTLIGAHVVNMTVFIFSGDSIPDARSGHRLVTDGMDIYSLGGYNPDYWGRENDEVTYYPLFREVSNSVRSFTTYQFLVESAYCEL